MSVGLFMSMIPSVLLSTFPFKVYRMLDKSSFFPFLSVEFYMKTSTRAKAAPFTWTGRQQFISGWSSDTGFGEISQENAIIYWL